MKRFFTLFLISGAILLTAAGCTQKVIIPDAGDNAPDFTLKNQSQINVTLSNFRGKRNVILVFYSLDFSTVCAGELFEYRKNIRRIKELNTEVFCISVDSYASHAAFRKKLKLPFDLLSDWNRSISKRYGIFSERESVAKRYSFLIDKKGVVRYRQSSRLNEARDFKSMMKKVKELET
jgi:mycoredoxin-dependent peroxiredoxin